MGTTLHAHIEVNKDGRWLHYGCPDVMHNYLVFACINGMRKDSFDNRPELYNKIRPVMKKSVIPDDIHSLPEDISEVTKICLEMDRMDYKLKGFGVLDSEGLENLQQQLNEIYDQFPFTTGFDKKPDLEEDIFKTYIGGGAIAAHRYFNDVRIVFWYDN